MPLESKRTLPGRVKLVAVALLALSAVVGVWLHASKGASTEVQSLAVDQTSVQVHVHNAATHAEAKAFCKEEYGDALNHVSFVCDLDETRVDPTVVFELEDERSLADATNVGTVHLLNNYQISFDVKIQSESTNWAQIFTLDAGEPKVGSFGRQPAVYLFPETTLFLVVFGTLENGNGDICEGHPSHFGVFPGEYVHITLVNKPTGVEFYADGVLRCSKAGDYVGRNRDAIVWLTSGDWPAADALMKNFKIKTWN